MNIGSIATAIGTRAGRASNRMVAPFERLLAPEVPDRLRDPPIFIIGPPRSGSTVLFQLLATRFDLAYFANLHCRLHGAPAAAERRHQTARHAPSTYESDFGRTAGRYGPSECGAYWYRFFPRDRHDVAAIPPGKERALRRSLGGLVVAAGRPFLIKNLMCTTRLPVLGRLFPEALFIVMRRDEVETAHSILEGRLKLFGDYAKWWSLQPSGYERLLAEPPEVQAIGQVRQTYRAIDTQRAGFGDDRFLEVSYAELCADTRGTLDAMAADLARRGVQLARRAEVPASLPKRGGVRIDRALYDRLEAYAATAIREES